MSPRIGRWMRENGFFDEVHMQKLLEIAVLDLVSKRTLHDLPDLVVIQRE